MHYEATLALVRKSQLYALLSTCLQLGIHGFSVLRNAGPDLLYCLACRTRHVEVKSCLVLSVSLSLRNPACD